MDSSLEFVIEQSNYVREYRQTIVTYLDLLGFRSLVDGSVGGDGIRQLCIQAYLRKMRGTMAWQQPGFGTSTADIDFHVYSFSDLVVRVRRFEQGSQDATLALNELISVAEIQFNLVSTSPICLRGGITYGDMITTNEIVFGPALIRAYDLERQVSKVPRVVVDSPLADILLRTSKTASDFLRLDQDGLWYVDYLFGSILHCFGGSEEHPGDTYRLERHGRTISNALMNEGEDANRVGNNQGLREKYVWLGKYHNETVERLLQRNQKLYHWIQHYVVPDDLLKL